MQQHPHYSSNIQKAARMATARRGTEAPKTRMEQETEPRGPFNEDG